MSDTPRTDAHYKQILDDALGLEYAETELRYWAEQLERELAAALAEPAIKDSLTVAKPVAWMSTKMAGVVIAHQPEDFQRHPDRWQPLYAAQMLLPATEYICKCGICVTPHRCKTDMEF